MIIPKALYQSTHSSVYDKVKCKIIIARYLIVWQGVCIF